MNRIQETFQTLADQGEKALVGFVTAGDPTLDRSREILRCLCQNGVDILELGVPFSDPTADGPVIQRSSQRALASGTTLTAVLDLAADLRPATEVPIVLFSYYNPIYRLGARVFYEQALAAGVDGVLIVDLPPEESAELTLDWDNARLPLIRLLAPTTPAERLAQITAEARGFLYLVSMTGVTGSGGLDAAAIAGLCGNIRALSRLPLCVGFGISTPDQVAQIAPLADGVVIGSAFERLLETQAEQPDLLDQLARQTQDFKAATRPDAS